MPGKNPKKHPDWQKLLTAEADVELKQMGVALHDLKGGGTDWSVQD